MKGVLCLAKKVMHRLWKIVTFRAGKYCKCGKKNSIMQHTFLHEYTEIGSYNYIGPYTQSLNTKIGNYCSISTGVKLGQSDHDYTCVSTSTQICGGNHGVKNYSMIDLDNPTVIENDVWIAANVIVRQGVKIGTGAVVGAGSVVTKDIPPYEIWAGVPAKFIKKRFDDDTVKMLLESKWWELDHKNAIECCKELQKQIEAN